MRYTKDCSLILIDTYFRNAAFAIWAHCPCDYPYIIFGKSGDKRLLLINLLIAINRLQHGFRNFDRYLSGCDISFIRFIVMGKSILWE